MEKEIVAGVLVAVVVALIVKNIQAIRQVSEETRVLKNELKEVQKVVNPKTK